MNPAIRHQSLVKMLIPVLALAGLCINVFLLTRTWGGAAIATTGSSKESPNSSVNCVAKEMYSPIRQSLETPRLPLHS